MNLNIGTALEYYFLATLLVLYRKRDGEAVRRAAEKFAGDVVREFERRVDAYAALITADPGQREWGAVVRNVGHVLDLVPKLKLGASFRSEADSILLKRKRRKYSRLVDECRTNRYPKRYDLICASLEHFRCYEYQLTRLPVDARRACVDAAERAIAYALVHDDIAPRVFQEGRPKRKLARRTTAVAAGDAHEPRRVYAECGIVHGAKYWTPPKGNVAVYGYRRPFAWETPPHFQGYEPATKHESFDYVYRLDDRYCEEARRAVIKSFEDEKRRKLIWHDVCIPREHFVGRRNQIEKVRTALKEDRLVAIHGSSGVGKTLCALVICEWYREYFNGHVVFLNAKSSQELHRSYNNLRRNMKMPRSKNAGGGELESTRSLAETARAAYSAFEGGQRCLFVFDEASTYKDLHDLLPLHLPRDLRAPNILITTNRSFAIDLRRELEDLSLARMQNLPTDIVFVELPPFTEAEAVDFLDSHLQIPVEDKHHLVRQLYCFPLLLQHVVADMNKRRIKMDITDGDSYKKVLFHILKKSLEDIANDGINHIVYTLAYVNTKYIPQELFQDEQDVDECMSTLEKHLIVHRTGNTKDECIYFNTHELYQEAIRLHINEKGSQKEVEVLQKILNFLRVRLKHTPELRRWGPHINSVWERACTHDSLVKEYVRPEQTGTTFFHLMCKGNEASTVETVLRHVDPGDVKSIVNQRDNDKKTPLHYAVRAKNREIIVKVLIDNGADVNHFDKDKITPLHVAARLGHVNIVETLIKSGARVDCVTEYKYTPLHYACINDSNVDSVNVLLNKGADVNARTRADFTSICLAVQNGQRAIFDVLLQRCGVDLECKTAYGDTLLHLAVKPADLNIIAALIERHLDVNASNKDQFTPLHKAVLDGRSKTVAYLLEQPETRVDLRTSNGKTPLDMALEMQADGTGGERGAEVDHIVELLTARMETRNGIHKPDKVEVVRRRSTGLWSCIRSYTD